MKIIISLIMMMMASSVPSNEILEKTAPETFKAKFVTTKGDFTITAHREWSPLGVDRLYQLIESGFYDNICVFRVVDGFVAQFGIHDKQEVTEFWKKNSIDDEPVKHSNKRGTISFARAGAKTRSSQLFINFSNNTNLDNYNAGGVVGYPPIAEVTDGMDVVDDFYNKYGEKPSGAQGEITTKGNSFLKEKFPKLDYILSATIIK
ncbi:peptidylprolyl isomerase [Candidatus Kapabacteria bacterium]|nr:peptidylprolyl isomerase [Candidatus Kapabacteria bacterium]